MLEANVVVNVAEWKSHSCHETANIVLVKGL